MCVFERKREREKSVVTNPLKSRGFGFSLALLGLSLQSLDTNIFVGERSRHRGNVLLRSLFCLLWTQEITRVRRGDV